MDKSFLNKYARRATKYGEHIKTYRDPMLTLMMLETLRLTTKIRVLDLACGQGDASRHLRAIGAEILYADGSAAMLSQGIKRGLISSDEALICSIEDNLPFADNTFDVVIIRYALHDIQDKKHLLNEIHRILRYGGSLQIVDMSCQSADEKSFYNELHGSKTYGEPNQCWIIDENELYSLLQACDFAVTAKEWYISRVKSTEWVEEEQITAARHIKMLQLTKKRLNENPGLKHSFGISLRNSSVHFCFPVIILVAHKDGGKDATKRRI